MGIIQVKDIEKELLETSEKREVKDRTYNPFYRINKKNKKVHINTFGTLLNGKTKDEIIAEVERLFEEAADEFNCKIEDLHVSSSNTHAFIERTRIETDAEFKDRIKWKAHHKARRLRDKRDQERREEKRKAKRIAELEAELTQLKKI
jgi:REP element-mobilizing transposase RayT